jgi:predicted nucleic acid-binding protein
MSFWDSSALVPALFPEANTAEIEQLFATDRGPAIWWVTPMECHSAIVRRERQGALPANLADAAIERLGMILEDAHSIAATEEVRERARRLLGVHPLRAADALQLAAALVWSEEQPAGKSFVCLDERLRDAARREGFVLLPT